MDPDPSGGAPAPTALASLQRFLRPRVVRERCALCGTDLADAHSHLVEPASRQLSCACEACALLFSGGAETRYRRVPRRLDYLGGFQLSDAAWEGLNLPINLAFFFQSTPAGGVVALYPSPAGATEAPVAESAWEELVAANPILRRFEPDVEGLLVNRVDEARECYRVGLDECFRLVGLIRLHWRGLSGGAAVWDEINRFFVDLKGRASDA